MPSWMSRLPISTADIFAATAAASDDLVRVAASIAVMTSHRLSATTSGIERLPPEQEAAGSNPVEGTQHHMAPIV